MVAIITGNGYGLERSSLSVLGAGGKVGSAQLGSGGQNVNVNASTGALTLSRPDEFLVGRGPDQSLALNYNSGAPAWLQNWVRGVLGLTGTVNTAGSTITLIGDFNDRPVFTYDVAKGAYVSKEGGGAYDEVRYAGGVWSLVDGDTRVTDYFEYSVPASGAFFRTRTVDADGNTQTYTYDESHRVTRITNADGGYTEMTYTGGRPNEIKTYATAGGPVLTRIRYTWDTAVSARMLSAIVDLSPEDNSIADGKTYVTSYTYDGTSRRIASITETDGSSLAITYDSSGRVTTLTEAISAGVTRVTTLAYHAGYTTVTDAQGGVTTLRYDERNQLVQITLPPASAGAPAQTTQFAYNANGDVVSVTDSAGSVTTFRYDSNGNQISRQDSLGNLVTRTYGARNELLTETLGEALPLTFVTTGPPPTITGGKILGSVDNVCSNAISVQSYTGGAVVAGRRYHPSNGYTLLGLTDGPVTPSAPNADYDYAFYFFENRILISENGAIVAEPVTSGASDHHYCQIEYDGAKVVYRINGSVVREVTAASGRTFHAGVSTAWSNRGVQGVTFASSNPPPSFVTTGPAQAIVPGKIVAATDDGWSTAISVQSHTGSAYAAGRRHHPANGYSLLGLTDKSGTELDYAFYFYEGGIMLIENGAIVSTPVANTATDNDFCQVEYDGAKVVYRINGAIVREVTTSGGRTFHAGVSTLYTDRGVQDFVFAEAAPARAFTSSGSALSYSGDKILAMTDGGWGAVTSAQTYSGSAYVAARRHHPATGYSIFGLTDAPIAPGTEYDYAFYFYEGSILLFENGAIVATAVANAATDDHYCQIEYDGAKVVYRINGAVVREVATSGGRTFHAAASGLYTGRGVQDFVFASALPATTRYVYDSENHLRFVIGGEGGVTEYRYNGVGQQVAKLEYTEHAADVASTLPRVSLYEGSPNFWVAWMADKNSFKRTDTYYDARGQVSNVVSYSSLSKYGEGSDSPLAIVAGAYTHVAQQPDGLYRITKTIETFSNWDAEAHSLRKVEGDFVLQLRPGQADKGTIGGMSASPAATADFINFDYGFYFAPGGTLCYMEKGSYPAIGTYVAGDNFWLERVGSTISYYKGATLAAAKAAGALRTRTGAAGALYFDASIYTWPAYLDAALTPRDVVARANTTVEAQADGLYRVTKTSGGGWDADARSTAKAEGDFVLRLRPNQSGRPMIGGVSAAPEAHASYEVDYSFYFTEGEAAYWIEGNSYGYLGVSYAPGDDFWLVRTGTTINYYKGATLEAALAAGSLRTRTGAVGTLYYDSSFLNIGSSMDVAFMPSPIVNSIGTTVTPVGDGMQRITKSGTVAEWDANARSTTRAEADFVLHLRPAQTNSYAMGGVGRWPEGTASLWDLAYSFYFHAGASLHVFENGQDIDLGISYSVGENFWMVRSGNSIGYYRGATLEAAMAAGALRTVSGVIGTFHFDSSIHSPGAAMEVEFTPTEAAGRSVEASRTRYVYDAAGQLLSRVTEGQQAETFVYDGLGRMVASKDRNQGTTSIVFNDAANQTVITLASGLVRTSTYDKAGNLISVAEGGSYVAGGTATSKYDKLGRLRMTTDATGFNKYFVYDKVGRLVGELNHRGDLTEYRYDANDRLIATTRYMNAVTAGNVAALADPNSALEMSALRPTWHPWDIWSWRTYDKEGRLTSTIDGTVRTYEYDKSGRLIKSVGYYNALSWEQAVAFQSNPPVTPFIPAADPRDSVTRNFYDRQGQLLAVLDGEGYLTRNVYDRAGQLVEKIAYATATAAADRVSGTLARLIAQQAAHADDRRTRFVYDGQGQLRFEIDALNQVTEYGYNGAGQRISTIRHSGTIPWWADCGYDNVKGLVAALRTPTSPPLRKSWNVYDGSGRLAFAIDPEGAVASFSYDNMGQVTKTVRFAAVRATTSAPDFTAMSSWAAAQSGNSANRITRTYYNARGESRYTVDPEGYVSRTDFDSAGRTVGEYRWNNPVSVSDATTIAGVDVASQYAGDWTGKTYTYAHGGQLTDFRDGVGNWTAYLYCGNGTLLMEFVVYGDEAYTYFEYDNWGRVARRSDASGAAEGAVTGYRYDGHGNLDRVLDPRSNATVRTFDHLGRLKTETDAASGVVTYEYNAFGDVTKLIDARGNATVNSYDQLGRLKSTTDALNNVTSYGYDDSGNLRTVTRGAAVTSFDYDLAGRVIKTTDAEGHYELYGLNGFGERISVRNKIGGTTVNAYDRRGLLVAETLPMASVNADGILVAATVTNRFEYDSRGNRTKKIEAFGLAEARTTTWTYDKADRLIETRGDSVPTMSQTNHNDQSWVAPTETLKYDTRNRVIEKTDALGGRTLYYYDKMSRVKAEIGPTGTYSAFTYDANGNMLTRRIYGTAVALPAVAGGAPPLPPAGEYRETSYGYDALNRLKTTTVALIRTGAWNAGTGFYEASRWATVTTTLDYDSNGNVVRSVDGNGNSSFAYYDKLNRKIAEVDREGYLTYLTLDGEGNVLWEHRYATALGGVTAASDPDALRAAAGEARATEFWYDRNGRRRFERRYGVQAYAVDPNSGALSGPTAVVAAIEYSYNGLGEVLRKTEANGDFVDYDYDQAGRLTRERRAGFVDFSGNWVRPTIDYSYDGLNALTRTRQGGEAAAGNDRVTRYYYGAGGRLASMYDAAGGGYHYHYDAAGNVVRESYYRHRYAAGGATEGLLYTRDQLGRVTSQGLASWNGSAWVRGDTQSTAYNAYGDVAQRGLNGGWQEQFFYDSAGRLEKSNAEDGVWRFFLYDGAGNRTMTVESEGMDLGGHEIEQVLYVASASYNTYLGNYYVDGLNVSIAQFDRRGQQVATRLPFRELAASTTAHLTSARTYNAYGEVTSETDPLGRTTSFLYNAMGRLIEKQSPWVDYTTESGATGNARPIERYYHDVSGRLIATEDANGNRIRRALAAGTGHGGSEALVSAEFHADGGVFRTQYDVFGDARVLWDELNWAEYRSYDAMGRLVQQTHRGGYLTDHYGYDILGQRITHWNTGLGDSHFEVTHYDVQGRVASQTVFGGLTTTYSYSWNGGIGTTGMGYFGGWTKTIGNPTGYASQETTDAFGRMVSRSDQSGRAYYFSYDMAGRLTSQTGPSGQSQSTSYFNTGRAYQIYDHPGDGNWVGATFGYDAAGNRTYEAYGNAYQWLQNATIDYDSHGRITAFTDRDGAGTIKRTFTNQYDLVGNVRRTTSSFPDIAHPQHANHTTDRWFAYDSMNRMTIANGHLSGGAIVAGGSGIALTYDAAGRRRSATQQVALVGYAEVWVDDEDHGGGGFEFEEPIEVGGGGEGGHSEPRQSNYMGMRREDYEYRADGYLMNVYFAEEGYYDSGNGYAVNNGVMGGSSIRAVNYRDALGRVTQYYEIGTLGDVIYNRHAIAYDAASRVTSEILSQKRLEGSWYTYTTTTTNQYNGFGGALSYSSASTVRSGSGGSSTTNSWTSYNYGLWDDARVSTTTHNAGTGQGDFTSTYTYDGLGRLASVGIQDGRPRTVTFTHNPNGQVLSRIETSAAASNPADYYYFVDGVQVGELSSNGNHDLTRATYSETFVTRNWNFNNNLTSQPFRWNTVNGMTRGQFGGSGYDPISPESNGMQGTDSRYTVREGDTLHGIAATLWGDSSLWYMIAEANGLSGAQSLAAGSTLIIPDKVTNIHNSARTFEVYDPNRALGDLSPTAAKPPKKAGNKCGVFGQIMMVVIAVAVTALTYGALGGAALTGMSAVLAGAAAGAAGSIASQAFGVATGIQDKFSWKGVALAALSGAVGGGVGQVLGKGGMLGSQFLGDAVRGAAASALTQGIGVAVGLQKKFDFAGVAAAGIGAGVFGAASRHMASKGLGVAPQDITPDTVRNAAFYANQGLSGAAAAIANAATRSLADGSDFGDNILAALPDVIGSTIGNMLADPVLGKIAKAREEAAQKAARRAAIDEALANPTRVYDDTPSVAEDMHALAEALPGGATIEEISGRRVTPAHPGLAAAPVTPQRDWGDGHQLGREWDALTKEEQRRFAPENYKTLAAQHGAVHNYLYSQERLPGQVTVQQLVDMGAQRRDARAYARTLSDAMGHYGIVSAEQRAAFLGNVYQETGRLRWLVELGGPEYFRRYDGRADLGNTRPGDGYRYRGRGFIQVTGRYNYTQRGYANNPDALADPVTGAQASAAWWQTNGLNPRSDRQLNFRQYRQVVRTVNGGTNHLNNRWNYYQSALGVFRRGN